MYPLTPGCRFERNGLVCWRFTLLRDLDGRVFCNTGSACRTGDGDWLMIRS
jgi:hypothetical protein